MTPLITLTVACSTFVVGFALGLMAWAMFSGLRRESDDHDDGAAEGRSDPFQSVTLPG